MLQNTRKEIDTPKYKYYNEFYTFKEICFFIFKITLAFVSFKYLYMIFEKNINE